MAETFEMPAQLYDGDRLISEASAKSRDPDEYVPSGDVGFLMREDRVQPSRMVIGGREFLLKDAPRLNKRELLRVTVEPDGAVDFRWRS